MVKEMKKLLRFRRFFSLLIVFMLVFTLFAGIAGSQTFPDAPTGLAATAVSTSRIDLSWTDNSDDETGFKIERRTGSGSYAQIATLEANVTTFSNTGLASNTQYTYRVRAYNDDGNSAYSNEASATTSPTGIIADAPSGLVATAVSTSRIELTWTDNSNNETGFKIERRTGSGSYAQIATVEANATSFSNMGLASDTQYTYRVRAYNDAGDSAYSNEASATTTTTPPQFITQILLRVGQTSYQVNGRTLFMDTAPIIVENRTLLPIRFVAEALGARVDWDARELKVTITMNNNRIELWVGNNTARVNGMQRFIDPDNQRVVPIVVPPGRTMMPLRFITETLGSRVDWNQQTGEITVNYPAP